MKKNYNRLKNKRLYAMLIVILAVAFIGYLLWPKQNYKPQITTLPQTTTNKTSTTSNLDPTTSTNTTSSKSSGTTVINDTGTQTTSTSPSPSVSNNISVSFVSTTQSTAGGPLAIRTVLTNISDNGNCTYTLTSGSTTKTYSSQTIFSGTYYSCNYDVPYANLSNGTWQLTVQVSQGNQSGQASTSVSIKG